MYRRDRSTALILCVAILSALTVPAWSHPPVNGRIAFVSNRNNGVTDVGSLNDGDDSYRLLTRSKANELYVDVSPDGTKVAFTRFTRTGGEIYTVPVGGGDVTRVTRNRVHDELPVWSLDSTKLAFVRFPKGESDGEIYFIPAEGGKATRITQNEVDDVDPRWSPDGKQLLYTGGNIDEGGLDVFVTTVGEPGAEVLTAPGVNDSFAEWSSNGSRIAYSSFVDGQWDLFMVLANGSQTTRLTDTPVDEYAPEWAPFGTKLLFVSGRLEGNVPRDEVHVMDVGTAEHESVSPARLDAFSPDWGPDGSRIVFIGQVDEPKRDLPEWEIFAVDVEGTRLTRLTDTRAQEFDPEWGSR